MVNVQCQRENKFKTSLVVYLTFFTMLLEVTFGYLTNSMALLADGWHMLSHVSALGLCWFAYYFFEKNKDNKNFKTGPDKILSLSGFTSAIILQLIAITMVIQSVEKLLHPSRILIGEALIVAVVGLLVNVLSAVFLHQPVEKRDYNLSAAYLHVLSDGFTSILAILSLLVALKYNLIFFDPLAGILGSLVITFWAVGLARTTAAELLDYSCR